MSAGSPNVPPAPPGPRPGAGLLLAGLAAGPAAWAAQLMLGYGLSSYACFPADAPLTTSPPPGWAGEHLSLLLINLVALAITVAAFAAGRSIWIRTRPRSGQSGSGPVAEVRARFLALTGMLTCGLFAAAIVFNAVAILLAPACWDIPQ